MRKDIPSTILCIIVLLFLFLGGGSMIFGLSQSEKADSDSLENETLDWRERYPFPSESPSQKQPSQATKKVEETQEATYLSTVTEFQDKLDQQKENLLGRQKFMELWGAFRRVTHQTKTEEVVLLNNGYLTTTVPATEEGVATAIADSVIALSKELQGKEIPVLYVQEPQKVCRYDDQMPPGAYSDINWNLDMHLNLLEKGNVPTLDLRESIHEDNLSHYDMFFRTDHHWKMSSGLWASEKIAEEINRRFGMDLDTSLLSAEKYREVTYENWYLGAQGRRVTRGYISPDDFTILLPTFPTDFRVQHPDKGIDTVGDFSQVMFCWDMLNTIDLYGHSTYEAILYGNRPLTKITNRQCDNGKKILLIHDSYATAVAPFLATTCQELHMIDVRKENGNFNGNLSAYIDEFQPDLVLFSFCSPVNIDRSKVP